MTKMFHPKCIEEWAMLRYLDQFWEKEEIKSKISADYISIIQKWIDKLRDENRDNEKYRAYTKQVLSNAATAISCYHSMSESINYLLIVFQDSHLLNKRVEDSMLGKNKGIELHKIIIRTIDYIVSGKSLTEYMNEYKDTFDKLDSASPWLKPSSSAIVKTDMTTPTNTEFNINHPTGLTMDYGKAIVELISNPNSSLREVMFYNLQDFSVYCLIVDNNRRLLKKLDIPIEDEASYANYTAVKNIPIYSAILTTQKYKNLSKHDYEEPINGVANYRGIKCIIYDEIHVKEDNKNSWIEWFRAQDVANCADIYERYCASVVLPKSKNRFFAELKDSSIDLSYDAKDVVYLSQVPIGTIMRAKNKANTPVYFVWRGTLPNDIRIGKNVYR